LDHAFEPGNFTTTGTAWGGNLSTCLGEVCGSGGFSEFIVENDTATDVDYLKVIRVAWSGICTNCTVQIESNLSVNFTGGFRTTHVFNGDNVSVSNFTVHGSNLVNVSVHFNVTEDSVSDVRLRVRVPNAFWYYQRPDTEGVLWHAINVRNVSSTVHTFAYVAVRVPSSHAFDSSTHHPRYNYCSAGMNVTNVPPTCVTLEDPVDVTSANAGDNGDLNLDYGGASNSRNQRRFLATFTDFLFRETIETGGTSGGGEEEGGGGGGGATTPTIIGGAVNFEFSPKNGGGVPVPPGGAYRQEFVILCKSSEPCIVTVSIEQFQQDISHRWATIRINGQSQTQQAFTVPSGTILIPGKATFNITVAVPMNVIERTYQFYVTGRATNSAVVRVPFVLPVGSGFCFVCLFQDLDKPVYTLPQPIGAFREITKAMAYGAILAALVVAYFYLTRKKRRKG
jgi:hypothetical protein